jgi:4-hydroxybenzoate polyprenyltransferase
LAAAFLYIAGNFLNDWMDAAWDQEYRPDRAIPSGLFSRNAYLLIAICLFLTANSLLWFIGGFVTIVGLLITILVVIYTVIHKKTPLSIWVMGSCRACLYLLGFAAVTFQLWQIQFIIILIDTRFILFVLWPMFGMCCYIAGISLLARYESRNVLDGKTKLIAVLLLFFPILTHTLGVMNFTLTLSGVFYWLRFCGVIPFALWTWNAIRRKNISVAKRVSLLLAGIALVDGVLAMNVAFQMFESIYFDVTWLGIPFIAFFLALLLQKIAPAT